MGTSRSRRGARKSEPGGAGLEAKTGAGGGISPLAQVEQFFEFCASNGDLGGTRRAAGHLGGSVVVHTGPFGIRAPPTRPSKHNFDAQTIFREETDRGNGIATSKTASIP